MLGFLIVHAGKKIGLNKLQLKCESPENKTILYYVNVSIEP